MKGLGQIAGRSLLSMQGITLMCEVHVILQASNSTGGGACSLIRGHTFTYVPYMSVPGSTLYKGVIQAAGQRISRDIEALTGAAADTEVTSLPCNCGVERLLHR